MATLHTTSSTPLIPPQVSILMTTNHIDHLDPALIRAGRTDKRIELPHADKEVMFRLFCMVFKRSTSDIQDPEKPTEGDAQYAHEFAGKLPELSPAEIQSFLLEHRSSARTAVERAQQWMERTREEKKKMKRADSFVTVFGIDCDICWGVIIILGSDWGGRLALLHFTPDCKNSFGLGREIYLRSPHIYLHSYGECLNATQPPSRIRLRLCSRPGVERNPIETIG